MVIKSPAANYDVCFSLEICNVRNPPLGKGLSLLML